MAGPTLADTAQDVEEFIDKVDEVHRLIEGLQAGTISPEYIDSKQQQKLQKERNSLELAKRPAGRGPTPVSDASVSPQGEDEGDQDAEAERRERAATKVKQLIANRERKLHARVRYEEHVKSQGKSQFSTDYTKWDIWCPDDEEDELINSLGPNTAQFRAMEKDIDDRHRQMVERRQLAERCRVQGNEAYKARQYSEALRCYQLGIDSERTNMALHANAAMAALKINCFVQAIEHCDKVLSIAEFFHNNKHDPLCVKALQRRSEAYRALQQHSRAVEDLQAALELEPGNAEAAKQLVKARQEDDEARKQRAIAKAVSRGAAATAAAASCSGDSTAAATPVVEATGLGLDLEKLGRLERLAASLAPAAVPVGQPGEASTAGSSQQQQRGPSLPPRRAAKGSAEGGAPGGSNGGATVRGDGPATTADVCSELQGLLRGDDSCCCYLRECGGLQHVATRVAKRPPGPGGAEDLAPLLLLLNDACMNDGNLKQLTSLKVLPAVVAALDGEGGQAAAAAAVTLLCTAVTNEDVRREVSKLLGAAEHLGHLVGLMAAAKPELQVVSLALLGNCMVDKPTKAAMAAVWRKDAAAADCFLALLRSSNSLLAEKAAVLLGNMATDAALRTDLVAGQCGVVHQLALLASSEGAAAEGAKAPGGPQQGQQQAALDVQRAAATALFNLTVDEAGQRLVAEDADGVARLYDLATAPRHDRVLAARVAGVCARAAKVPAGAATLLGLGAIGGMLSAASASLDSVEAGAASGETSSDREPAVAVLDAAVRTLTILTSPDDPALAAQLVAAGGVEALLRIVRSAGSGRPAGSGAGAASAQLLGESVVANAVLCLGGVARCKEHLPLLRGLDPVPPLLAVAYEGRGNTASKNAAIALARMAHEPAMLEKLRELHGIEIIYKYVKP